MPIDAISDNRPVITVLDPSSSVRAAVEALLRPLPARITGFATAGEFLLALDDGLVPACLIADAALPDMPAARLLAQLKERGRALPTIILLASDADVSNTVDAMRAGAITCIEKPYMARFLVAQVAPLVDDRPAPPVPTIP